jgi:diguanylate cyclase (GGDEF)-like protein
LSTAITVSIGIAHRNADDNVAQLLQRADEAMYSAKERGRNRVAIDSVLDD